MCHLKHGIISCVWRRFSWPLCESKASFPHHTRVSQSSRLVLGNYRYRGACQIMSYRHIAAYVIDVYTWIRVQTIKNISNTQEITTKKKKNSKIRGDIIVFCGICLARWSQLLSIPIQLTPYPSRSGYYRRTIDQQSKRETMVSLKAKTDAVLGRIQAVKILPKQKRI